MSQAYSPMDRQGLCIPTTTQGMSALRAPSIAAAAQL